MIFAFSIVCLILATVGVLYTCAAVFTVRRYVAKNKYLAAAKSRSPVTILKPLRGVHPGLRDDLLSFVNQQHDAGVQIIIGLHDPGDPALAVVAAIRDESADGLPHMQVVIDGSRHGSNNKVSNLINMLPHARHPVIVLADSDIRLEAGDIAAVAAELDAPGTGLVTCLYLGDPRAGLLSQLSAMAVDHHFLPSVTVGLALGLAQPTFGALIALRRDTLAATGGFEALADTLADDYALGAAVRRLGLAGEVSTRIVRHAATEDNLAALLRHELRWARTIRTVDPAGFAGSIVTHPVPFAALALLAAGPGVLTVTALVAALASRAMLQVQGPSASFRVSRLRRIVLGPVRDMLSFGVFVASFFVSTVEWSGARLDIRKDGTMAENRRAN